MPPNSEIEKLERRWKENPKGTVFAPYAEVLRKHGDYPLAKDVLRQGLELHPDHIPGNIVLGRCCLDLGEEGPAEAAFTHVLDLDAENVIALKALAEITERQGRLMEAVNWLSRLIAVDPSNDEAREQLVRVDSAREAASVALASPTAPVEVDAEKTATITVIQPRTPPALELSSTEAASGEVEEVEDEAEIDADAAIEAALDRFSGPVSPSPAVLSIPELLPGLESLPAPSRGEAAPISGLIPGGFEHPAAEPAIEPAPLSDPESPTPEVYAIGLEEPASIDLLGTSRSEFQPPDDSMALLELASGQSQFQEPDAAADLVISGREGSEFQTPSGSEELLKSITAMPPPAVEPPVPEGSSVTTGFAAISLMPTEELPAPEPAPVSVIETLAAAGDSVGPAADGPANAEPGSSRPSGSDLRLIFPDEAAEPEPPRVRRISEETAVVADRPRVEGVEGEPAPVVTETMAELYARQGHIGEALNVYRILVARRPNDSRLAGRLRELEETQAAGSRRMSYVAVDTGGESVESFFRSLIDARPADPGSVASSREETMGAAPTRPANDPLSLSAIFGEEGSSATSSTGESPARPSAPDSFSFDQFFAGGGRGGSSSASGPRPSMPSDEDLDQFQNWLKSLKR